MYPPRASVWFLCVVTLGFVLARANAAETAPAQKAPAAAVGSQVIDFEKLAVRTTKTGERRELFNGPTATLTNFSGHITTLNPGETPHAPHKHPDEELIVVKTGTIEVNINGQLQRVGPGSVLFYASNDVHGIKNVGTVPATYLVFRFITAATPKPEAAAAK
jgi:quercetin dioxygenase-like cupin family protein